MRIAFAQFFNMLAVLFSAGEKAAKSLDNLATVGEEMSAGFVDQTRLERQQKLAQLKAEAKQLKTAA